MNGPGGMDRLANTPPCPHLLIPKLLLIAHSLSLALLPTVCASPSAPKLRAFVRRGLERLQHGAVHRNALARCRRISRRMSDMQHGGKRTTAIDAAGGAPPIPPQRVAQFRAAHIERARGSWGGQSKRKSSAFSSNMQVRESAWPLPHLRPDWAHPCPRLRQSWARPSLICTGTVGSPRAAPVRSVRPAALSAARCA